MQDYPSYPINIKSKSSQSRYTSWITMLTDGTNNNAHSILFWGAHDAPTIIHVHKTTCMYM